MFGRPPKPSALDAALLEVITDAVPRGRASIESAWVADAKGWFVAVVPKSADACPIALGAHPRNQVRITLGQGTTFEVYGVARASDLGIVRRIVEAVVAGRVEEYGDGRGWVKVAIGPGRATFEGGPRAGWRPWPFRGRPRTYTRY